MSDPAPIVSVVMPAFNAAAYVAEAIESVLAQRFEQVELLVADDGSTDGTGAAIARYRSQPGVRCFTNPRNVGAAATRNGLLREARGRYVVPCDADDLMLPGHLRRLSDFLDAHPDVGTVYADILVVRTGPDDALLEPPTLCGADCRTHWDLVTNVVNHGGSMSRRDVLLAVGGYDETVRSVDDWSLWLKVAEVTRIHYLAGEVYYVWRRHPRSMTQTDPDAERDSMKIVREAAHRRGFR